MHNMLPFLAQLKEVDTALLDAIVSEIEAAAIEWNEPYPEYGSDGMQVATLLNPTGEQLNFDYRDCQNPAATPLLRQLPSLHKFLAESGFAIMGSRLLRLLPGTFLHEHRDFVYLQDIARYRLHLPLVTNKNAFIVTPATNVHFKRGYLWKLDPKATVHSAGNFGDAPRIHLLLDCYANPALLALLNQQKLDQDCLFEKPVFDAQAKDMLMSQAEKALAAGQIKEAEEILLRSFCQYRLQNITSYDLIFELFERSNYAQRQERIDYWRGRLKEVYPPQTADALAAV